jgi:hypothetical protein
MPAPNAGPEPSRASAEPMAKSYEPRAAGRTSPHDFPIGPAPSYLCSSMEPLREEYIAMRETIRARGTARLVLLPAVIAAWAATAVATAAVITIAISTLVPLMVLVAGFEAIYALHFNVERIGRYLQVFHEPEDGWEHVAMAYGQHFPGSGPDPLFSRLFVMAASINFIPAALGGDVPEIVVLAVLHLLFINRIRVARGVSAKQRVDDLQRFTALKQNPASRIPTPESR